MEVPQTVANLLLWLRADTQDLAIATGVSAWLSKVGSWLFTQALGANQPALTTAPELGGRNVVRFDGVNDQLLATSAAAIWSCLHNGAGSTVIYVCVLRGTGTMHTVLATSQTAETFIGCVHALWGAAINLIAAYIMNGSGTARAINVGTASGNILGAATVVDFSYQELASPEYVLRRLANVLASGLSGNAPSASDPSYTLSIGASGGGTNFGQIDVAEVLIYSRNLTVSEKDRIYAYLGERYAFEAAFDALAPYAQWRTDQGVAVSGANVTTWTDRINSFVFNGIGNPQYAASNVNLASRPSITIVGGVSSLVSADNPLDWAWLHEGGLGHTAYVVYYHAATANYRYLLATNTFGAEYPGYTLNCFGTSPGAGIFNAAAGSSQAVASGVYSAGKRWMASRAQPASPDVTVQARASTSPGWVSGGSVAPSSLAPTSTLQMALTTGTIAVAEVILFDRYLSDAEHTIVANYFTARYGSCA